MAQFRAVLHPRVGDRTEQAFFTSLAQAREWGYVMFKSRHRKLTQEQWSKLPLNERSVVRIFEMKEVLVEGNGPRPVELEVEVEPGG
jgi:hypothetical protein